MNGLRRLVGASVVACAILTLPTGCETNAVRARIQRENDDLRRTQSELRRTIAQHVANETQLREQVATLTAFDADRPVNLFAPVKIKIASRSSGADYDGNPGHDGVTVYLRPFDIDGDVVKAPGAITVQLLDNSNLAAPRILGTYAFDNPADLRAMWHSHFMTDHYTLKCPFDADATISGLRKVTVSVKFLDYLTGATLSAVKEVDVNTGDAE